jgi:hypothetical protein
MKQIAHVAVILGSLFAAWSVRAADAPNVIPRLETPINLDLTRVPLSDLCWVMERRTGVAHRVADAATGDLLASAIGEFTLAQLRQAMADVLGVEWKQIGSGEESSFVAERSPTRVAEAARMRALTDRAFREDLQRLLGAANLSDEAIDKLPHDVKTRLGPGSREAMQLLGYFSSEEQSGVLSGLSVSRALAAVPPEGQARARRIVDEIDRQNQQRSDNAENPEGNISVQTRRLNLDDGSSWRVKIGPEPALREPGNLLLMIRVSSPGEPGIGIGVPVRIPTPDRHAISTYRLTDSGPPRKEPLSSSQLPVVYRPLGSRWEQIMRDLARTLKRPIVADAYVPDEYLLADASPSREKDETLEAFLDRACRDYWYRRWGRVDPVLTFQRVDWAVRRRTQIPNSQARPWKQHIIEAGRVSVEDLLQMASLTSYQLLNLVSILGNQADQVTEHRDLLLLWKEMPDGSRRKATETGIPIRDLPLALQPQARSLVSTALGSAAALVLANARILVEQSDEAFTFSVRSPDRPPIVRRVGLKCSRAWVAHLQEEEKARDAALQVAAGSPTALGPGR